MPRTKAIDKVSITYHDSANPGKVVLSVSDDDENCSECGATKENGVHRSNLHPKFHIFRLRRHPVRLTLTPTELAQLAGRFLEVVASEGFTLTATARK